MSVLQGPILINDEPRFYIAHPLDLLICFSKVVVMIWISEIGKVRFVMVKVGDGPSRSGDEYTRVFYVNSLTLKFFDLLRQVLYGEGHMG